MYRALFSGFRQISLIVAGLSLIYGINASSPALAAEAIALNPAKTQPDLTKLKPGLAVTYYFGKFDHIDQLNAMIKYSKGKAGQPLPFLNYDEGEGNVLGSEYADLVGAHITGMIKLDKAGTYTMQMLSNDGVTTMIGEQLVYSNPAKQTGDSLGPEFTVAVSKPGWYPIDVKYFERKGTWAIRLLWRAPGATGALEPVPAEAYSFTPSS